MQQQHLLNRMRPHGDNAARRALELLDPQRLPTHRMRLALDPPFEESLVSQEGHGGVAEQVASAHDFTASHCFWDFGRRGKGSGSAYRLPSPSSKPLA